MAAHARPDQRHLADVVVVEQLGEADLVFQRVQLGHRGGSAVARAGERDVGLAVLDLGDVLQHHVDVHVGVGDGPEHLGRVPRDVGQPDDGHLGLAAVVRDTGQEGVSMGMSLIDPTTTVPSLSEYDDRTCTGML